MVLDKTVHLRINGFLKKINKYIFKGKLCSQDKDEVSLDSKK